MTAPDHMEQQDAGDAGSHQAVAPTGRPQGLARSRDAGATGLQKLEDSRLIHRNDSVRGQADAFRELRTRLIELGGDRNFVTLVASASPGCGGSFVARNLAAAFAFDDAKSALLIDCDALRPSQQQVLAAGPVEDGLIDYLDGQASDIGRIQYDTIVPRLQLIPSGSAREVTGEYFTSFRMRALIDSLRESRGNRYLILDAPPVLQTPDARILSELADVVVLVAGYGRVTQENLQKCAANFAPEKFAGIVFNERP